MPSGLEVRLFDIIFETDPEVARFRFLAPQIGRESFGFGEVIEDIEFLCAAVIVPSLAANDWTGDRVVVSLSAAEVPFGSSAPDVTQFFQPFDIREGECQWLDF